MPSNSRLFVKPFIGGINTEMSSVEDAILYTTDELNCTILPEGIRGRRLGFNIERDGEWIGEDEISDKDIFEDSDQTSPTSFSGYYWKNVNKTGKNIIVCQSNRKLMFFDADNKPFSAKVNYLGHCNISRYCHIHSGDDIGDLRYAIGDGKLFVVGDNVYPFKVIYTGSKFIPSGFSIYVRDIEGVDDDLDIDEMPQVKTVEGSSDPFPGLSDKHHYNLLNQGWSDDDIATFGTDKNKWPSNNLQWFLGKDDSGKYHTEKLLQTYFGNTPAPKGHFIIDYFDKNREEVSGVGLQNYSDSFKYKRWHVSHRNIVATYLGPLWLDKYFKKGETNVKKISIKFTKLRRKSAKKSYDDKWAGDLDVKVWGGNVDNNVDISEWLENQDSFNSLGQANNNNYGANVVWKLLKEESFNIKEGATSTNPEIINIDLNNNDKKYSMYVIKLVFSNGNGIGDCPGVIETEGVVYYGEDSGSIVFKETYEIPTTKSVKDIAYMPGRLFYLVNDTVLFSQTIKESGEGFDKCYQDADPTSEEISDVIPTDGGYVKLNNLGVGQTLETFNRGVLVFGENIVYGLISPLDKNFTATEYDIVELSRAGIIGPKSAVSTDSMVYYWSPLGIFRIGINPQTGSTLIAESITHTTIQEWYDRIPNESKETCRGCFDYVNNRIYWYYSDLENGDEYVTHKLNRCLVYDLTYNSFMPFKIEGNKFIADVFDTKSSYEISPTLYLRVNGKKVVSDGVPVIAAEEDEEFKRWTAIQHIIADDEGNISFGDYNSREFKDFDEEEYDSYMISRPIMFAGYSSVGNPVQDTSSDKQVPILQTLFKRTEQGRLNPKPLPTYYRNEDRMDIGQFSTSTNTIFTNIDGSFKNGTITVDLTDFEKPIWHITVTVYGYKDGEYMGVVGSGYWTNSTKPDKIVIDMEQRSDVECDKIDVYCDVHHGQSTTEGNTNIHTRTKIVIDDGTNKTNSQQYIAASGANIRMRWGWALDERSNRWDMVQNGYRPQKDFLHDEYVESRIHVRGRGKAFQIEIRNNSNKDFRLAGMNLLVRNK
jgi:hypothetical protein